MSKKEVDAAVARYFYATGTPFHNIENPHIKEMINMVSTLLLVLHTCTRDKDTLSLHACIHTRNHAHTPCKENVGYHLD